MRNCRLLFAPSCVRECLTCCWQALLPVLYDYGVYAESCDGGEGGKLDPSYPCLKMRSKLALVFRSPFPPPSIDGRVPPVF